MENKPSIPDIVERWKVKYKEKDTDTIVSPNNRREVFPYLFATFKEFGYSHEEIHTSFNIKKIVDACVPDRMRDDRKRRAWREVVEKEVKECIYMYLVPDIISTKAPTIEKKKEEELPEDDFIRKSKPIHPGLFDKKGSGAAKSNPDKEFCDFLEIPEDRR